MGECCPKDSPVFLRLQRLLQITRQWLNENKTPAGGFLREQLKIVGVEWPPAKGWVKQVVGQLIPDDDARRFEALTSTERKHGTDL